MITASNIQESNSVNHFNLCATIWKLRIFERTPAIRNFGKKSVTDQKRWQISKNNLYNWVGFIYKNITLMFS
jgi:hypothetical protein